MTATAWTLPEVDAAIERKRHGTQLAEEAHELSRDLRKYTRAAWPHVIPRPMVASWYIDSICDHTQALYEREITRLIVTVPPGHLKSSIVSVIGPSWRWTHAPWERIVSASWHEPLSMRDTRKSRMLMQNRWFLARWGHLFNLARDENLKGRYSNDVGGHRIATHVGGGTGDRGDVLLIDDPHNAKEAQSELLTQMMSAVDWYGDTWISRLNDSADDPGVMCVIAQRIHEADLIAHLLEGGDSEWTHLCLPAEYEVPRDLHPHAPYPKEVKLPSGKVMQGDPRTKRGELLAPNYMTVRRLSELKREMGSHVAAGQLQQRPTAREGGLLKRAWWSYYMPRGNEETDDAFVKRMPNFTGIVHSWDCPQKELESSDLCAGQVYGVYGADRYLLDARSAIMGYPVAKRSVIEMVTWTATLWPHARQTVLIEKGGYGIDLIRDLKRLITGVQEIPEKGDRLPDKYSRAESASDSLSSGNVHLPGYPLPSNLGPDEKRCPSITVELVSDAAAFPFGRYKDRVDAWSQAMNWLRKHTMQQMRGTVPKGNLPRVGTLPGAGR